MLVLIGTKKAIGFAVRNLTVTKRNSNLCLRLRDSAGDESADRKIKSKKC